MVVIGITGGLGSGKTTVAQMFRELGAKVLDADQLAHQVITPEGNCFKQIIEYFGLNVLTRGHVSRKKLAAVVFSNPPALKVLEKIVHPEVIQKMRDEISYYRRQQRVKGVVVDVPLLFESGFDKAVDYIVVVKANKTQQINRSMQRLSITKEDVLKRLHRQMPMVNKVKLADIVIDNSRTLAHTRKQVERIWARVAQRRKG